MHGRMAPLQGEYFSNLFVHSYPKGNLAWADVPADSSSSPAATVADGADDSCVGEGRVLRGKGGGDGGGKDSVVRGDVFVDGSYDVDVGMGEVNGEVVLSPEGLYDIWQRMTTG